MGSATIIMAILEAGRCFSPQLKTVWPKICGPKASPTNNSQVARGNPDSLTPKANDAARSSRAVVE